MFELSQVPNSTVRQQIQRVSTLLRANPAVIEVVLFGSCLSKDCPNDIDLVLVVADDDSLDQWLEFCNQQSAPFPLDFKLTDDGDGFPSRVTTVTRGMIDDTYCGDRPSDFFAGAQTLWRR